MAQDPYEYKKIVPAVEAHYKRLATHRDNRNRLLKKLAGTRYENDSKQNRQPTVFNFLSLATQVFGRAMYPKNPFVMVNTAVDSLRGTARKFEMSLNHLLPLIEFEKQMRIVVTNALTGMGIMKTGLMKIERAPQFGIDFSYGQPYSMAVDLDDFVYDTKAKTWNDITFCGNRQTVPLSWAKNNEAFNPDAREHLGPNPHNGLNRDGTEQIKTLSTGNDGRSDEDIEDYVDLWDIWLPKTGRLLTMAVDGGGDVPLLEVEWDGPRHGPFQVLGYQEIPNNIMPVSPASAWEEFHDALNSILRKLIQQAKREKNFTGVVRGSERDGEKMAKVKDGGMISIDGPNGVVPIKLGGPDGPTMGFFQALNIIASRAAGNLDTLGGLAQQADTLGQEQLLAQGSNRQVQEMQQRTTAFTKSIVKDIGFWLWSDTRIVFPLSIEIAGVQVPANLTPEIRSASQYNDYNIDLNVYSLQDETPATQMQKLKDGLGTFGPLSPVLNQQGKALNLPEFVLQWARYANFKDVDKLLVNIDPNAMPQPGQQPVDDPQVSWPKEPRVEIRKSVSAQNTSGQQALLGKAMNQNLQPKEQAQLAG